MKFKAFKSKRYDSKVSTPEIKEFLLIGVCCFSREHMTTAQENIVAYYPWYFPGNYIRVKDNI